MSRSPRKFLVDPAHYLQLDDEYVGLHESYVMEFFDSANAWAWHYELVRQRWMREQEEQLQREKEEEEEKKALENFNTFDPTDLQTDLEGIAKRCRSDSR